MNRNTNQVKGCTRDKPISYRQAFLIFLERQRQLIDKWARPENLPIYSTSLFDDCYKLIKEIEQLPIEDNHQ